MMLNAKVTVHSTAEYYHHMTLVEVNLWPDL